MAITEEHQKSRDGLRKSIYVQLYGRAAYRWSPEKGADKDFTPASADGTSDQFGASANAPTPKQPVLEHKSYIPPTPFNPDARNPFGSVLDAPLR